MKALLYKEFNLVVNPLFYLIALFSALILIPQWVFFVALLYFCFMSAPNLFTLSKSYKEIYFSATQPVRRRDIVMARIITISVLEIAQLAVAAICVAIRLTIWNRPNFFMDANIAFLGLSFVMFGLFNVVMMPMFYKTAYKIAIPAIVATAVALLFAGAIELGIVYDVLFVRIFDGMQTTTAHIITLIAGIVIFAGLNYIAYRVSATRFEKIDL